MPAGPAPDPPPSSESGAKVLYSPEHTRLVQLLREVRREAGLTQLEVAGRLGRPMDYVSRMEGGQQRIDVIEWLRLLRAIGADPITFLQRLGPAFRPPLSLGSPSARRTRSRGGGRPGPSKPPGA